MMHQRPVRLTRPEPPDTHGALRLWRLACGSAEQVLRHPQGLPCRGGTAHEGTCSLLARGGHHT
jgi:hypothetical protein